MGVRVLLAEGALEEVIAALRHVNVETGVAVLEDDLISPLLRRPLVTRLELLRCLPRRNRSQQTNGLTGWRANGVPGMPTNGTQRFVINAGHAKG